MEGVYVIVSLIGLLIWCAILQPLIYSGTKTKERMKTEKAQLRLLAEIARKAGVSDEEIQNILTPKKVKEGRFW